MAKLLSTALQLRPSRCFGHEDLKEKKWHRIFKSSKFVEANLDQARSEIIASTTKKGTVTRGVEAIPFTDCPRAWWGLKSKSAKATNSVWRNFFHWQHQIPQHAA